jgi:hypothetical protein
MDDLVAFLRERRNMPEVRVKASAVQEAFGETSPEALVGRRLPVPTEGGVVEYRLSEYLVQQDAFVVTRVSDVARPDLVAFLNARYDEEERTAKYAAEGAVYLGDPLEPLMFIETDESAHLIIDPARVLAEVDAKRRTVKLAEVAAGASNVDPDAPLFMDRVLMYLALPYADHPDYLEKWKP